ncbi:FKBP-type peptidyl-prolyl cis-trans isomerase [Prosthecobacter sp.]|uniref:FKBP-type peptidyl-prolyl cis-trans isomerase n=1 Tax=Prosthecobacter sp. TaxID=1965333 RepID=UPI003783DEB6
MKLSLLSLSLSAASLLFIAGCQTKPEPKKTANDSTQAAVNAADRITTASGLQYQVIANGPAGGRSPTATDSVTVHYIGMLTNGTVFDSSLDRGQPLTLGVNQVIPGWTEALQLMKPGDQWLLHIPARLGYGSQGAGEKIPPNSDLIFKVALISVNGAQ